MEETKFFTGYYFSAWYRGREGERANNTFVKEDRRDVRKRREQTAETVLGSTKQDRCMVHDCGSSGRI